MNDISEKGTEIYEVKDGVMIEIQPNKKPNEVRCYDCLFCKDLGTYRSDGEMTLKKICLLGNKEVTEASSCDEGERRII